MERNSKSGVIGVIITIIILVLLVVFTNRNTENISTIENFANVVIVPIQNGLTYLKNKINNKSRLVAGYCWNWVSEGKNKSDIHDIVIPEYDFGMSWNLGNSNTWAIDKESINEIGCIHTCQGLEFDYVGVIVGDDLRYENGHIVTDYTKRAKTDQSLKGINKIAKERGLEEAKKIADEIIKNTYKTLMTRGMKGCYIYCTDKKLQEYLKSNIIK